MLHNVCSTTERIVRVIVGLAVMSLLVLLEGTDRYWGLLGLLPIATAIFRYCPVSHLLHIDTCKIKHA